MLENNGSGNTSSGSSRSPLNLPGKELDQDPTTAVDSHQMANLEWKGMLMHRYSLSSVRDAVFANHGTKFTSRMVAEILMDVANCVRDL